MLVQEELPNAHLLRWFLITGGIGVAIALVLTVLLPSDRVPTQVALLLWPSSIVALIDPRTFWSQVMTGVLTFGGQFLLYGLVGLCFGYIIYGVRRFFKRTKSS